MQILVPLALVLGLVLLFLAVCALGRGWLAWVLTGAVGLGALGAGGAWSTPWFLAIAIPFVLAAIVVGVVPVRRALLGRAVLQGVGTILPRMSETEKEALDAGTVWWDADLFGGSPDWRKLLEFRPQELSVSERAFLDGPVEELCRMLDDHQIAQDGDLPESVWTFIREKGFMGMIVPESYGGLGFSAIAHSAIVTKLSSRSGVAAVTVMVPNSLGPAELLLHYGTEEQKDYWLPRLSRGEEIPCFALTEPGAGSDAGSMTSRGVVCKGEWEGKEVLGMRLTWNKRYITLSPIATVVGLAFKLSDPDHLLGENEDLGITCALIPADTKGVLTGERHDPLGVPFMNGTTYGEDVFVPLEFVIGGAPNAGRGWRMLMQSLAAGRGISLPSLSAGACQLAVRTTGAYATLREQFGLPIGKFEGVQEPLARIAGLNYAVDATRYLTVGSIDAGEKPSVITAMAKAWSTEAMRTVINDAMDVVGGAGISRGPRNVLAALYQAVPIGITVEGANILTRTMIVFGQGAMRCHPWVQQELETNAAKDVAGFDTAFFGHVNHVFTNAGRAFYHGLFDGAFASVPISGEAGRALKRLTRSSAAFALLADVAMGTLGSALKRKEALSGRLADALAWQYFGSAIVARYVRDGLPERDRPAFRWAIQHALFEIERAMLGLLQNLPNRPAAWLLRRTVFPIGARRQPPSDRAGGALARAILEGGALREALSHDVYLPGGEEDGLGRLEAALQTVLAARPAQDKVRVAQKAKKLPRGRGAVVYDAALAAGVIDAEERKALDRATAARTDAVQVDAFASESVHAGAL